MKKSKFSESQIVAILKEGDAGVPVAQILCKYGIGEATYYVWKSKYRSASVAELKRLKELEAENAKLKRMYADLASENAAIKDVLSRNYDAVGEARARYSRTATPMGRSAASAWMVSPSPTTSATPRLAPSRAGPGAAALRTRGALTCTGG